MIMFSYHIHRRFMLLAGFVLHSALLAVSAIDEGSHRVTFSRDRITRIGQELKRADISRKAGRVAIVSALVAVGCYAAYTYYADTKNEGILKLSEYPPTLSWPWIQRISALVRDSLITGALSSGILQAESFTELFKPISIEWYIKRRIHLFDTIDELHQSVVVLDNQHPFSESERIYAQELLVSSTRSLVDQIEQLLGFIEFKKELCKTNLHSLEVLTSIESYLAQITQQLVQDVMGAPNKESSVKRYCLSLEKIVVRLGHIEQDFEFFAHHDSQPSKVSHG